MGTQRQKEILDRVASNQSCFSKVICPPARCRLDDDRRSLCGLGQTAASAVLSAMELVARGL